MTASLFVTGTPAAAAGRRVRENHDAIAPAVRVAHAVARPVVDGLESSVCGLLVTVTAAEDWLAVRNVPRCAECSRIAG
jgi:hypothetical protein